MTVGGLNFSCPRCNNPLFFTFKLADEGDSTNREVHCPDAARFGLWPWTFIRSDEGLCPPAELRDPRATPSVPAAYGPVPAGDARTPDLRAAVPRDDRSLP